jgi:hypothetical protein
MAIVFLTEKQLFERHCKDEHHGYTRRSMDEFKVERAFAGSFWCGFCIAVIENPVSGDTDGTPRVKYRYDHIDKHLNEGTPGVKNRYDHIDKHRLEGKTKTRTWVSVVISLFLHQSCCGMPY